MDLAATFAEFGIGLSAQFGGPLRPGSVVRTGPPVTDDGGSIVTPGTVTVADCSVQVDTVTEAMRQADGYTDEDMRLLVMAATLEGTVDTDASIEVLSGPYFGRWSIASVASDPFGVYWDCRGRLTSTQIDRYLNGECDAVSSVTGDITLDCRLSGTVAAISSAAGALRLDAFFAGTSTPAASVTGTISLAAKLSGASSGSSSVYGAGSLAANLVGASAGASSVTGALTGTAALAGTSAGASTAGGTLAEIFAGFTFALDFKNGFYRSGNTFATAPSLLPGYSYSRTGAKSEQDSTGAVVAFAANAPGIASGVGYWARAAFTNLLLNAGSSSTLSTQNVTVTAQAYTLSFIGTGTVTLSGTSTAGPLVGTGANNRVSLTFTPTAGTLTLTVSGSVTYAGLVTGSMPGPIIATAGSTATAAADAMSFSQPIPADVDWVIYATVNSQTTAPAAEASLSLNSGATTNRASLYRMAGGPLQASETSAGVSITPVSGVSQTTAGRQVIALRHRAGKFTLGAKNSAAAVSLSVDTTGAYPIGMNIIEIGRQVGAIPANAPVEFVGFKLGTLTDTDLTNLLTAA